MQKKAKNRKQQSRSFVMPRFYKTALDETVISIEEELVNFDWSIMHLAETAGLSPTTIYNFRNRNTRFPHYMTIIKLAKAVGLKVELTR